MSAQIVQIRDYQPKRKEEKLKEQAAEILGQVLGGGSTVVAPYGGAGIDGIPYQAPPEDCA